jgi:hypothetical protein
MSIYIKQAKDFIKLANEALLETPPDYGKHEEFFKKAISFYEQELVGNPDADEIYLKMGQLRLLLNDKVGASQDFEKAKELANSKASK